CGCFKSPVTQSFALQHCSHSSLAPACTAFYIGGRSKFLAVGDNAGGRGGSRDQRAGGGPHVGHRRGGGCAVREGGLPGRPRQDRGRGRRRRRPRLHGLQPGELIPPPIPPPATRTPSTSTHTV
ncbi:hypothetical protein Taro_048658, partial [Colocasia esculenta]|nr:hypothetical protein [Colocasia esculenta]